MKDPVYVFGHRRSGNHFLIETIRLNFGITPLKHHGDFERVRSVIGSHRCLSIVRDGRDVLGSSFFWWRESGESAMSEIQRSFRRYSFSEYLGGKVQCPGFTDADDRGGVGQWDIDAGLISDPVRRWASHVNGFLNKVPVIHYSDLAENPSETILRIGEILGEPMQNDSPRPVTKRVGFNPARHLGTRLQRAVYLARTGHPKAIRGPNRAIFSPEDHTLFQRLAGETIHRIEAQRHSP